MKALAWHGKRDVRVDNVPDPTIREPTDAVGPGPSAARWSMRRAKATKCNFRSFSVPLCVPDIVSRFAGDGRCQAVVPPVTGSGGSACFR